MSRARDKANSTVSNFASTGIDDNADANAITIDASENVGIGTNSPISNSTTNLQIHGGTASGSSELRLTNADTGATASDGLQLQMYQGTQAFINNRENGPIIFKTNNTEEMRLLAGGGLTFNGDTAAANALSDFETGSWTPAYSGTAGATTHTYTQQKGRYVKIGDVVHAYFALQTSATSGGSGSATVGGLPYTIDGGSPYVSGIVGLASGFTTDDCPTGMLGAFGQNYMFLYKTLSNSNQTNVGVNDFVTGNGNEMYGSITYRTA